MQNVLLHAQVISIGPTIRQYFGAHTSYRTFGFELAFYGKVGTNGIYPSFCFGYERGRDLRCYSYEIQITSIGDFEHGGPPLISGLSMGLCNLNDGFKKSRTAIQLGFWSGFFALGELKFRGDKYEKSTSIGGMVKFPLGPITH